MSEWVNDDETNQKKKKKQQQDDGVGMVDGRGWGGRFSETERE